MASAGQGFGTSAKDVEVRLPRPTKVKNKQPNDRQITAEQILRESKEIQLEDEFTAPKQIITDPEELSEYRLKKRKEFEDLIRRVGRFNSAVWVKVRAHPTAPLAPHSHAARPSRMWLAS
jgi:crooked neck